MSWHKLVDSTDNDLECCDCGVIMSDEAASSFFLECPTDRCTDHMNDGYPCVFVPTGKGCVCSYCERPGREN